MDFFGLILGWNWKIQRTRRRWDRLREHALGKKGRVRMKALRDLDEVEDKLRTLEEERLSRRDRTRMLREVKLGLANVNDLLERGEEWLRPQEGVQHPEKNSLNSVFF
jgi:hypothetical protein